MHSGMRRVPAERARHAKRLGHVQAASEAVAPVLPGDSAGAANATTSQGATTATTATTPATSSAKQPSSSALPSSSPTQSSSSVPSSATVPSTSSVAFSTSAHSLEPPTAPPSSIVITLTSTSATSSSTPTPQSATAVANHGLSGGAIAGIVAGAVIVGIALIVFFVRKTYLRRRETKRISWNGAPGLGAGFHDEPEPVPDISEHSPSFINAANIPQRSAPLSPFDARGKSMYSTPPPPVQLPTMPAYAIPTPPSATYNNPTYPTRLVPSTYNPGNVAAFAMAHGHANTGISSTLPSVVAQRTPMEAMVKCTFVPTLPDELSITTGERIFIVEQYDDGWDLCMNRRGERGMVPRECLEHAFSDQPDIGWKNVKRLSSLNPDGKRF